MIEENVFYTIRELVFICEEHGIPLTYGKLKYGIAQGVLPSTQQASIRGKAHHLIKGSDFIQWAGVFEHGKN